MFIGNIVNAIPGLVFKEILTTLTMVYNTVLISNDRMKYIKCIDSIVSHICLQYIIYW